MQHPHSERGGPFGGRSGGPFGGHRQHRPRGGFGPDGPGFTVRARLPFTVDTATVLSGRP